MEKETYFFNEFYNRKAYVFFQIKKFTFPFLFLPTFLTANGKEGLNITFFCTFFYRKFHF